MKKIRAIIRISKMNETKVALAAIGFPSITVTGKVEGRGKGAGYGPRYQELVNNPETRSELLTLGEIPKLKTKRMIDIIVKDENVNEAVETIVKINKTGNSGDGKIFVIPVSDSIQVRTGSIGDQVLD
jgi:nitrogen regulatory protein PII 2